MNKLFCGIKFCDDTLYGVYMSLIVGLDRMSNEMGFSNKFIRNICHSRQVLFFFVLLSHFSMIYNNTKIKDDSSDVKVLLYYIYICGFIVNMVAISFLKLYNFKHQIIKRNEDLEKFIVGKQPELRHNQCEVCKVIKCMRSFHCRWCNNCISKFEIHSNWFNTCIGSENLLVYSLVLVLSSMLFCFGLLNNYFQIYYSWQKETPDYDYRGKDFILHVYSIWMTFLSIKLAQYSKSFVKHSLFRNITHNELNNSNHLPYLWKNMSREPFNPFNRGAANNFREAMMSLFNTQIKGGIYYNFPAQIDDIIVEDAKDASVVDLDSDSRVDVVRIDSSDTFYADDNTAYYQCFTGENVNHIWNKYRIYTIMDVLNSPFRQIVINSLNR